MRPGCGALFLIGLVAGIVSPVQVSAQARKPELQRPSTGAYTAVPPVPAIMCDVSSASVSPGQSVEVTTRLVSGDASGLKFSFESSAGKLTVAGVNASTARLDTAGVPAGEINVTCVVVDAYGRRVSYGKVVRVGTGKIAEPQSPAKHFPGSDAAPALPAKKAETTDAVHSSPTLPRPLPLPPPPPPAPAPVRVPQPSAPPPAETPQYVPPRATVTAPVSGAKPPPVTAPVEGTKTPPVTAPVSGAKPPPVTEPVEGTKTPAETTAATDADSKEYAEGLAIERWKNGLKTGAIEVNVPKKMSLPNATAVNVVVHGYADKSGPVQAGASLVPLKVSQRMRIELSAEHPDEFKIEMDGTDAVQLVPIDGTATWQWKVTPKEPAADEKLTVRALLVYPDDPNKPAIELEPSYTVDVSVQVGSVWEWSKYLFWNDPIGLVKYLLPGGAGFAFVAGLVTWWWKRKHPEKKPKE